jgi:hypothetical protein
MADADAPRSDAGTASNELRYVSALPRDDLRKALRRPGAFAPPLRILAEDVLGADAPIDFVAVDPSGRVVLVLIAEEGNDEALLTAALAQRAWVRPRIRDWLKLGPDLEVSASAPVVAALLCPTFKAATQAAAADLGPDIILLSTFRCIRDGADATVLVEPLERDRTLEDTSTPAPAPSRPPDAARSDRSSRFRSGLSEADLGLTAEETREFQ